MGKYDDLVLAEASATQVLIAIANELAELNEHLRERTEDDFNDLVRAWLGG